MERLVSEDIVKLIENDEFFAALSHEELQKSASYFYERKYPKGQVLFTEGDPCDRFYYTIDGFVRLEKEDVSGVNTFYCYVKEKIFFPYVNMFREGFYNHTAVALTDIRVLYIPVKILEELFNDNKSLLLKLINSLEDLVLTREERLQYMLQQNARMRVIATVAYLLKELGTPTGNTVLITCPVSVIDIAAMSGTSRETAGAVLSKLREKGIIELKGKRHFEILKPELFDPMPDIDKIFLW